MFDLLRTRPRSSLRPSTAFSAGLSALLLAIASTAQAAPRATATCFEAAGQRYGVPPALLAAIAWQESGMNPSATNRNTNGTSDIGLMQINTSWLPKLARHGVSEQALRDPCVNTMVAAWILAANLRQMGPGVQALGAYNARDPAKRVAYARQVLKRYVALREAMRGGPVSLPTKRALRSR